MVEWKISETPLNYEEAEAFMKNRVSEIKKTLSEEMIWFLEHPPLYTAGSSAKKEDLLNEAFFPIYETNRGGELTYHGPGQQVIYLMLNLKNRTPDLKRYVFFLEEWLIQSLLLLGVEAMRKEGYIGVWVNTNGQDKKIAAIGVHISQWVTSHGVAINVDPDLDHYQGIVPCGIREFGVTSLRELGVAIDKKNLIDILKKTWVEVFKKL